MGGRAVTVTAMLHRQRYTVIEERRWVLLKILRGDTDELGEEQ